MVCDFVVVTTLVVETVNATTGVTVRSRSHRRDSSDSGSDPGGDPDGKCEKRERACCAEMARFESSSVVFADGAFVRPHHAAKYGALIRRVAGADAVVRVTKETGSKRTPCRSAAYST